jgi:hypothetical protein
MALTPRIRKVTAYQPTAAVISGQTKTAFRPAAGTAHLNATQLAAGSPPTSIVRSGQSKIPT